MTEPRIVRIWPGGAKVVDGDDELAAWYSKGVGGPHVRVNFISSVDGSATVDGRSGMLGGSADKRVFDVLRRLCDVVVVGAGTVRDERYGAMRMDADQAGWRVAHGLSEHPVFAIVSGRLDLDPSSPIFTAAPVRPLVLTTSGAPAAVRASLSGVADIVECGASLVDPRLMVDALIARGLSRIHCEGGPSLFGAMIAAGVVDELCLTLSPMLVAGTGPRISASAAPAVPRGMALIQVLESDGTLLLRYTAQAAASDSASMIV